MLLVVGVVRKVNGRPSTSTPRGAKISGGIELKIGRINYLEGLTKRVKFQISNPSGVVWAIIDGVKYALLGFVFIFSCRLSYPRAQVARDRKSHYKDNRE